MKPTTPATPTPERRPWASALVLALAGLALGACARPPEPPQEPADRYRVRGVVRQLPGGPGGELYVHHEAVPDFKSSDGEVVGMEAMAMPFPVADPELLAGLEPGDKVEMEFEVRWRGDGSPLRVTALEELPPETRLDFEADPDGTGDGEPATGDSESPEP